MPERQGRSASHAGEKCVGLKRKGIPVFARFENITQQSKPLYRVNEAEALDLLDRGKVERIGRRGRALRALSDPAPGRQDSLRMGPAVIEDAAAGVNRALVATEAWRTPAQETPATKSFMRSNQIEPAN